MSSISPEEILREWGYNTNQTPIEASTPSLIVLSFKHSDRLLRGSRLVLRWLLKKLGFQ